MLKEKLLGIGAAMAAISLAFSGAALAGTATANVAVSASVTNNCVLGSSPALSFGAYDPIVTNASSAATASGTIDVTCTTGASWTLGLGTGANSANATGTTRAMAGPSSTYMNYDIYTDSGHTTVWDTSTNTDSGTGTAAAQTATMYGQIPAGQTSVQAGSYTDTVVATVTF